MLLCTHRKIHLTVMRVKSVDGQEHTGVYLPWQHAQVVLNALKEAEPELANVKVAGGKHSRRRQQQDAFCCLCHVRQSSCASAWCQPCAGAINNVWMS